MEAAVSGLSGSDTRANMAIGRMQLIAMTIVVCTGFSSQMVVPIWIGQVIEHFHINSATAGSIASIEFLTVAITSIVMATLIGRTPSKLICIVGTLLLLAGNLGSMLASTIETLSAARVVCGVGKGLVIAVIFGLAGQTLRPVRSFAILNAAYAGFSAVIFFTVPHVVTRFGMQGAFGSMVVITLFGMIFLPWIPQAIRDPQAMGWLKSLPIKPRGLLMLFGLSLMWTAHGSVWVFVERIGVRNGLELATIGAALSAGAMLSILGPLTSSFLEIKRGATLPIIAGILVLAGIAGVLCLSYSQTAYLIGAPIFSLAGLFVLPYVMGLLGYIDPTGKLSASSSAFMTLGGSLGPLAGGLIIDRAGYPSLAIGAWVLFGLVLALMLPLARFHDRSER